MPSLRALLLLRVLAAPVLATDESSLPSGVKDVANQLRLYLDYLSQTGSRPDFTAAGVRAIRSPFDLQQSAALVCLNLLSKKRGGAIFGLAHNFLFGRSAGIALLTLIDTGADRVFHQERGPRRAE